LRKPNQIWIPRFQLQAFGLANIPLDYLDHFITDCVGRVATLNGTHKFAAKMQQLCAAHDHIVAKEGASLRKKVTRAEEQLSELRISYQRLINDLKASSSNAQKMASNTDAQRECLALRAALRDKDALLVKVQSQVDALVTESVELREFVTLVLEPSPDAPIPTSYREVLTDPATWRLVFVGGHDRLHQKLRRVLKNTVFLHPDTSHVPVEVFDNADAVIFSVNYCNHTLVGRVANEVRRRGLRAGYANHSNVDLILDEIRTVLAPRDHGATPAVA
jgi:hypothetical protein